MFGLNNKKRLYGELNSLLVKYYTKILGWQFAKLKFKDLQRMYNEIIEEIMPLLKKWTDNRKLKKELILLSYP